MAVGNVFSLYIFTIDLNVYTVSLDTSHACLHKGLLSAQVGIQTDEIFFGSVQGGMRVVCDSFLEFLSQ